MTCLLLYIKFLFFFRVYERFGLYFTIIISVARQIFYFIVLLFIIIMGFAHSFYILLKPKNNYPLDKYLKNDDPNNPWNMVSTYNQIFEDKTISPNPFIIQIPNEKTNMFAD